MLTDIAASQNKLWKNEPALATESWEYTNVVSRNRCINGTQRRSQQEAENPVVQAN